MRWVFILAFICLVNLMFSQKTDPSFPQFKSNSFNTNFKLAFSASTKTIIRTNNNFALQHPERKPMFCRMEDKLHDKFKVWLQLRAGSDQDYRKLAFPEKIDKRKSKLIE